MPQRESRWQWRIALGDRTISVQSGGAARTGITFPKLGAHLPAFKQPQPRQGWSRRKGKTPRICSETRRDSSPHPSQPPEPPPGAAMKSGRFSCLGKGGTYRDRHHSQGSGLAGDPSLTVLCVPGTRTALFPRGNPTLSKFSRSSSNSALGGSCPAFVPSGIGAAERCCHRVLGKRDARMGPMSGQGLWAGGTPGGLHRKRFPLGRDVLLAPQPAPPRVSAGSLSRGSSHGFPSRASPNSELAA